MQTTTQAKILETAYKKICEAFETKFIPRGQFEEELTYQSKLFLDTLSSLPEIYNQLKDSESEEVIRIARDEYILKRFNDKARYPFSNKPKFSIEDIERLKTEEEDYYTDYSEEYDKCLEKAGVDFVVPFTEFLVEKTEKIISEINEDQLSVNFLLWSYFRENKYLKYQIEEELWLQRQEIIKKAVEKRTKLNKEIIEKAVEKTIQKFKDKYLSNKYLQLLDKAEQEILDIDFTGISDKPIINVGVRTNDSQRNGWTTTTFKILNNGKEYSFQSSSKDEKLISGEFIHIFIIQSAKKRLLKLVITTNETEQIYFGGKDFEKVSLKNECEILITKHHGNETIIFETRKDAKDFQEKVFEMRNR